jgi:hypothetical protein
MKKTLALLVASTALTAALGVPAFSALTPSPKEPTRLDRAARRATNGPLGGGCSCRGACIAEFRASPRPQAPPGTQYA